ncbi:MAG: hypothetical protein AAF638_04550, partial [Pseudomonadota bacterium]
MSRLARLVALAIAGVGLGAPVGRADAAVDCQRMSVAETRYLVCTVDVTRANLIMAHTAANGTPYGRLSSFVRAREDEGKAVPLAVNGGMYHADLGPVGYYVEKRDRRVRANTRPGPG